MQAWWEIITPLTWRLQESTSSFLTLNQDSPEPSGSALLSLWVSCIITSTSFRESASSAFLLSLCLILLSLSCPIHTHTSYASLQNAQTYNPVVWWVTSLRASNGFQFLTTITIAAVNFFLHVNFVGPNNGHRINSQGWKWWVGEFCDTYNCCQIAFLKRLNIFHSHYTKGLIISQHWPKEFFKTLHFEACEIIANILICIHFIID